MKRGILSALVVLLLLIFPIVYSATNLNDYNDYTSLRLNVKLTNSFYNQNSNGKIDYINANLSFFPRNEGAQTVESLIPFSEPAVTNLHHDEIFIPFSWDKPSASNFLIGFEANITLNNSLYIVDKKVSFPLQPISTQYVKAGERTDIDDDIKAKAQELATGEDDLYVIAFNIAEWVNKNVKYDLNAANPESAMKSSDVMAKKIGVCGDISNLFISMMRSLGIPARFVSGMAYSNINQGWGPHAWAEVYFPDYGWIPFDATYRQYGWVDPSHIRFRTSFDSGEPSIKYLWKGSGANMKMGKIDVQANLIESKDKLKGSPVLLEVKPLATNVGPGSYVPIEIKVINNNNFYVPLTLTITKAQQLEGSNVRNLLIKPNEKKSTYWVMKVPDQVDPMHIFTTIVEVEDNFHSTASGSVVYRFSGDIYSKEKALATTTLIPDKFTEEKKITKKLDLTCNHTSYTFYYETFNINCTLRNLGNSEIKNIHICLANDCKVSNLGIAEESYPSFSLSGLEKGTQKIMISANGQGIDDEYNGEFEVLGDPDLQIKEFTYPGAIDFNGNLEVNSVFVVKTPVNNVTVYVDNTRIANIGELENSKKVKMTLLPTAFSKDTGFNIKVTFQDRNNKMYSIGRNYPITVLNTPWYVKLVRWIRGN